MDDVKKCGYLRKQKSMRRRFFVLRGPGPRGPSRLEYYENEKKFRLGDGSGGPRGTIVLEEAFGVNKRADAKRRHLLVLYTRDGGLCVSADGEEEQDAWYQAIQELQAQARALSTPSEDGATWPGPAFREVWQVSLRPRGLGQTRNLSGVYRLCLTERTLSLLRLRCDAASVTLQLMNVRRCGHSDNYFFVEVGRSAVTGPGELWMQVEDSVVAQNMHETILEAMKSLSEEFRPRTRSQSLSSTPITVPSRRHLPNPPPPSQVGLPRRPRTDTSPKPRGQSPHSPPEDGGEPGHHPPASADYGSASSDEYGSSPGFEPPTFLPPSPTIETNYISMGRRRPQTLELEEATGRAARSEGEDSYAMMGRRDPGAGYMPMLPGSRSSQDYMPMTPNSLSPPAPVEVAGYVLMSPLGSCSPPSGDVSVGSADSQASDYMNMWPLSRSASSTPPAQRPPGIPASYRSLPRSYKMDALPPSSSSSDSLEDAGGGRKRRPLSVSVDTWRPGPHRRRPPSPGESVDTWRPGPHRRRPPSPGEYVSIHYPHRAESMDNHPQVPNGDYTHMAFEAKGRRAPGKMAAGAEKTPVERSHRPPATFWPIDPTDGVRAETPEDPALRGLLTAVSGCHLLRTEARSRHCSLTAANGSRPPVEEAGLNYIDLDLAKEAPGPSAALGGPNVLPPMKTGNMAPAPCTNTYASIDFQMSGDLRRGSRDETEC